MGLRIPTGQRQSSWLFTENKSSLRSGRLDLNSGLLNCKSSALTTRPPCLSMDRLAIISIAVSQKAKDINLLSAFQNERTSAVFLLNCQQRK